MSSSLWLDVGDDRSLTSRHAFTVTLLYLSLPSSPQTLSTFIEVLRRQEKVRHVARRSPFLHARGYALLIALDH